MKLGRAISTLAALGLSSVAAGCGSSATCGVAPCGGDIVGSWEGRSACVDQATLNMDFLAGVMGSCPTASLGAVTLMPRGTVTFVGDKTFTGALAVDSIIPITFPDVCIREGPCDEVTQVLQSLVGMGGVTAVTCAGDVGCTCAMSLIQDIITGPGTWSTSGTTLAFTGPTGTPDDGAYCVQGSSLHIVDVDMATKMKVIGDIVLGKR
jgi:hypothetical protein